MLSAGTSLINNGSEGVRIHLGNQEIVFHAS